MYHNTCNHGENITKINVLKFLTSESSLLTGIELWHTRVKIRRTYRALRSRSTDIVEVLWFCRAKPNLQATTPISSSIHSTEVLMSSTINPPALTRPLNLAEDKWKESLAPLTLSYSPNQAKLFTSFPVILHFDIVDHPTLNNSEHTTYRWHSIPYVIIPSYTQTGWTMILSLSFLCYYRMATYQRHQSFHKVYWF